MGDQTTSIHHAVNTRASEERMVLDWCHGQSLWCSACRTFNQRRLWKVFWNSTIYRGNEGSLPVFADSKGTNNNCIWLQQLLYWSYTGARLPAWSFLRCLHKPCKVGKQWSVTCWAIPWAWLQSLPTKSLQINSPSEVPEWLPSTLQAHSLCWRWTWWSLSLSNIKRRRLHLGTERIQTFGLLARWREFRGQCRSYSLDNWVWSIAVVSKIVWCLRAFSLPEVFQYISSFTWNHAWAYPYFCVILV